jgi:hypothetical protein
VAEISSSRKAGRERCFSDVAITQNVHLPRGRRKILNSMLGARKIIGFFIIVAFVIFITVIILMNQNRIVSPVPEEGAIRIIYISPSPTGTVSPSTTSKP